MTWVKVCGLSRRHEVDAAVEAGADAVGFVAVPSSPRFLDLDRIAGLVEGVPPTVRRILLTIDLSPGELQEAVAVTGVDGVQPYGLRAPEAASAAAAAGLFVLQPLRVGDIGGFPEPVAGVLPLFDTHRPGRHGGTGEVFDWAVLDNEDGDYVVAGGLFPDNVAALVRRLRPWGVDASSRLEVRPGMKDIGKVAAFVEEAKRA